MKENEIELLLYRILSGKLIFYYKGERYELKNPDFLLKYESQIIYDNIINEEKYNDWIREEEAEWYLISLGLWTKDTTIIMNDLEKKIDNCKVDLFKLSLMKDKQLPIRKKLNSYKQQLAKIMDKKTDFASNTLEGYANAIKNEYLICNTLFKNDKRVFKDTASSNENSYAYFNNLVNEINRYGISIQTFKELARHQLWKSYWNYNKQNIFNCSLHDLTDDQKTLINITRMYDSVYEHHDCPSDEVIEDDDMLEGWMILQKRKNEQSKNQQKIEALNPKLKNAQEVFIMTNNQESYEQVMSLNSEEAKFRLKEKVAYINSHGNVSDSQLPDVKRSIISQATRSLKNRK